VAPRPAEAAAAGREAVKLLWFQDLDPMVSAGGAQLNDRAIIQLGYQLGLDIQIVVPESGPPSLDDVGAVIISNATRFPVGMYQELQDKGAPYIFFFHDYWPMCKWRLFYSQEEKCKTCFLKERWLPIIQEAALLIWLSPLHRQAWLWSYPELRRHRYALVPSAIDPGQFHDLGLDRKGTVAVDSGLAFKGSSMFLEWAEAHPEEPITLAGPVEGLVLPPNVTAIGMVPYQQMNQLYNRHQTFLHLPTTAQPFDRTVAEAYLASCRVTGNKNVGALSWPFFKKGPAAVAEAVGSAPLTFWKAVARAV